MKITLNAYLTRALEAAGLDAGKLGSAVNAAYCDGTAVVQAETSEKLAGTTANEKRGLFRSREATGTVREGKLTDPLRMLNYSAGLDAFQRKYGAPFGELTVDVIPAGLRAWLDGKFRKDKGTPKPVAKKDDKAAKRGMTPAGMPAVAPVGNGVIAAPAGEVRGKG